MTDKLQIPENMGSNIKGLRKRKGLTLKEMSEKTGLSMGFISKIERGQSTPSIGNLQKICYVLGITIDDLATPAPAGTGGAEGRPAEEEDEPGLLIKSSGRSLVYNLSDIVKLETIYAGSSNYKLEAMTLKGAKTEYVSSKHPHDELGVVARGVLSIVLNGKKKYIIEEGDALLIPAETEHTIQKVSEEECISYWFKIFNT